MSSIVHMRSSGLISFPRHVTKPYMVGLLGGHINDCDESCTFHFDWNAFENHFANTLHMLAYR